MECNKKRKSKQNKKPSNTINPLRFFVFRFVVRVLCAMLCVFSHSPRGSSTHTTTSTPLTILVCDEPATHKKKKEKNNEKIRL